MASMFLNILSNQVPVASNVVYPTPWTEILSNTAIYLVSMSLATASITTSNLRYEVEVSPQGQRGN